MLNVRADLHAPEQLVYLFIRHFLAQLCEHVSKLASPDEPVPFLVEDLEPADELVYDGDGNEATERSVGVGSRITDVARSGQ